MTLVSSVLGIVPGLQATALVGYNLKNIPDFRMKPNRRMGRSSMGLAGRGNIKHSQKPLKRIVKTGIVTLVGISLIKPTATMINQIN